MRTKQDCRLKSEKQIGKLFTEGRSTFSFPIKIAFLFSKTETKYQRFGVSVSKRMFKKAVDRNRIKRQMREAYRHNKTLLQSQTDYSLDLMFIYVGKEKLDYQTIFQGTKKAIAKIRNFNTLAEA